MELGLGTRRFDVTHRPLVMGILNRTKDSFHDPGAYFELHDFLARSDRLVREGADLLEVGARAAGVGTRDVDEAEETELVASSILELRKRFDVPLAVDTWRASVAVAAFDCGAVLANDVSGFSDPDYLPAAAAAGASVVATHIRLRPRVPDPEPRYGDVVDDVAAALSRLVDLATQAGVGAKRIVVDPGLDLGKTWQQSVRLLARMDRFSALGHPVLLAASNKIFLGRALGLERGERGLATVAACAVGVAHGARVLRVHDVLGARQVADLFALVSQARERDDDDT
jgi:dihydropteroate synthase